ncbi:MAG: SRPBCC family protein [Actinomycetota bacterium]|nr:SRPBCC family protein [Actinomycetota bacterium]
MVRIELEVDRPVAEVFDYLADFRNETDWNSVAHDVAQLNAGPVAVGARFRGEYDRMGSMEYEIQEYARPNHLRGKGKAKMLTWYSTFDFSGHEGGTRLVATIDPHPKGALWLAKPLMGLVMKGQMQKGMRNVKATLERRPGVGHG